ncbi:hypothetical protein [Salinicoccus roseus]|uniref:Uncharacterized protein n=1 Tax=Salinicoccus roseus TaxID=45670 RepID=A0ABT4YEN9_9STAP|nr:hypothetical protein [Salinicoccus roseus]MDB0579164.1 hypothetical protein [Salinicoccus roseus]
MIDSASFYIISILLVIIISILIALSTRKYILMPIAVFIIMALTAFIVPNFMEDTNWEPLMGYAVFLGILSLIVSILTWLYIRGRRRKKALADEHSRAEDVDHTDHTRDERRR